MKNTVTPQGVPLVGSPLVTPSMTVTYQWYLFFVNLATWVGSITGEIKAFGGANVPTGFLLCDGSAVSRVTYITLFGVIGTRWGTGNGATTFNVPNLVGDVSATINWIIKT